MTTPNAHSDPLRWLREFRARLAKGESLSAQQFATEQRLSTTDETFVDLIFAEFLELELRGDQQAHAAILERYPAQAEEIKQQIMLHRAFQSGGPSQSTHPSIQPHHDTNRIQQETFTDEALPTIPGFEVLRILGRGGMGVVLLAKELQLGRFVAIKLLLGGELASKEQRQRFRAEARAAAALRHPNIVQVDDVGEVEGQPFIVMEYVAGGTLEEFLRQQRLSAREAAQFIREIAWAVHAAHQTGIVHRDLKPGNLLLALRSETDEDSPRPQDTSERSAIANQGSLGARTNRISDYEPKITDFGLAKSLHPIEIGQAALTVKGDVLGTPCYMSPEQARGDMVRPATDIYSLGSILYELLSGAPPFQRATPWETVQCVLEQQPPSLATRVPVDLRTICEKCLRKEPGDRYGSMAALAVDLGLFLQGRSIAARRVGSWTRLVQWAKRNVAVASLLAVVGLTLCTLLIVSLWSRWTLQEMLVDSQQAKRQESLALQSAREQLWENLLSEAQAIQTSRQIGQRYRSLENVQTAQQLIPTVGATSERQSHLRDTAIAALPLLDVQRVPITSMPLGNQTFISADRKFRRMALRQSDGTINIIQFAEQTVLRQFRPDQANSVVISPDGRYLLVNHRKSVLHGLDDTALKRTIGSNGQWPVFSEDSNLIAWYDPLGLFVHNIQTKRTVRIHDVPRPSMPMLFSPDGSRLAVVCQDRLLIASTDPTAPTVELPGPNLAQQGQTLAWHPSGDYLAVGLYSDRVIAVWHLPTRYQAKTFRAGGHRHNLYFDRTGQYLTAVGLWGGSREVFEFATQDSLLQLPRDTGYAFGEDETNSMLVLSGFSQNSLESWRIENQVVTQFLEPAHILAKQRSHCVLSTCGHWLLVNGEFGLEIYDAIAGRPAGTIPIGRLDYSGVLAVQNGDLMLLHGGGCQQWSLRSGQLEGPWHWPVPPGISLIEVSADRRWGLCSDGGSVYLHDSTGVEPLRFLGHQADVRSASFDLVHGRVATGSWNASEIIIWNVNSAREERRVNSGHQAVVRFSPNGNYLFASANGGSIWEVDSWHEWRLNSPDGSAEGFGFAFSPDSRWLAHTSGTGQIKIRDLQQRTTVANLTDPSQHHYFSLAFSADNETIFGVTIGQECYVKRWDLKRIDQYLGDLKLPPLTLGSDVAPILPKPETAVTTRLQIPNDPNFAPLVEQQVLGRARQAFVEKRWAWGLAELRLAALTAPDNENLHTELAWRLVTVPLEYQDPLAALSAIRVPLRSNNDDRTLFIFAFILAKLKQHEEALTIVTNLQLSGHLKIVAKYLEAQLLAELGRREDARSVLMVAHELEAHPIEHIEMPDVVWDRFRREVDQTVNRVKPPVQRPKFRLKIFWPKNWSDFVRFCSELRYRWWGN